MFSNHFISLIQLTVLIILKIFNAFDAQNDDEFQYIFVNHDENELVSVIINGETEQDFSISDVKIHDDKSPNFLSLILIFDVLSNDVLQKAYYELINE
jgi:hypothetical protein